MAALAVGAPRPVLGPVPIFPFLLQRRKKAVSFKHWGEEWGRAGAQQGASQQGAGGRGQQVEATAVQCLSDMVLSRQTGSSFQSLGESGGLLG